MIDLSTTYMGMKLRSPIVASSSPLCERIDSLKRLEDAGVGAVVLPSLFEEQLSLEGMNLADSLDQGADSFPEAHSFFPELRDYKMGPDLYLEHIQQAKEALGIPVIASLNGTTPRGWVKFALDMQQAGADALELNMYNVPTDPDQSAAELETQYLELVGMVCARVGIPVSVKISPFYTAPRHFARQLTFEGADALVLFNRFYQPDFDIENLDVVPNLRLSTSEELRLRLRWVAILFDPDNMADLAVTGGVHGSRDVLKCMMAGASVACMTSALLLHGPGYVSKVHDEMRAWMAEHEYVSLEQMRGNMALRTSPNPAEFERANYIKILSSYLGDQARV